MVFNVLCFEQLNFTLGRQIRAEKIIGKKSTFFGVFFCSLD